MTYTCTHDDDGLDNGALRESGEQDFFCLFCSVDIRIDSIPALFESSEALWKTENDNVCGKTPQSPVGTL
jgi:hypothetical protein